MSMTSRMSRSMTWKISYIFMLTLLFLSHRLANADLSTENENEDDSELLELLKIDEQELIEEGDTKDKQHLQEKKDAEVLSKAQRIVLELNGNHVKTIFDENEYVIVLGYAPWCAKSAELMPEFAEAANKLKELGSEILLAKIDAERHPKVAASIGIKGFPTLLLYYNKKHEAFQGEHTWQDIVTWARKKTGFPVLRIGSVAEAELFIKNDPSFLLGFFDSSVTGTEYEEFVMAAKSDEETQYVEVRDFEVAKILYPDIRKPNRLIGFVKTEPDRYTEYYGEFEVNKILQFVDLNKFPLVIKLTNSNSRKIYASPVKIQVMIFADDDSYNSFLNPLHEIARKYKSKVMLVYVNIKDDILAKPYLSLFGLENSQDTVVVSFRNNDSSKYLLEKDPSPENIDEFCSQLFDGSHQPFYKSQEIPENTKGTVQIVVGKTFDEMVLKSKKHVFLEVHTPWCMQCDAVSKKVQKLAKHFRDWEDVVIGSIDASQNEHPKLKIDDFPALLMYLAHDKENPITLSSGASTKDLAGSIKFIIKPQDEL